MMFFRPESRRHLEQRGREAWPEEMEPRWQDCMPTGRREISNAREIDERHGLCREAARVVSCGCRPVAREGASKRFYI